MKKKRDTIECCGQRNMNFFILNLFTYHLYGVSFVWTRICNFRFVAEKEHVLFALNFLFFLSLCIHQINTLFEFFVTAGLSAWEFKFIAVRKHMSFVCAYLCKWFTTNNTLIRSFVCMNSILSSMEKRNMISNSSVCKINDLPHMRLIRSGMVEFFWAKFTGERLLICMLSHMELVCFGIKECLLTFYIISIKKVAFVRTFICVWFSVTTIICVVCDLSFLKLYSKILFT